MNRNEISLNTLVLINQFILQSVEKNEDEKLKRALKKRIKHITIFIRLNIINKYNLLLC